MKKVVYIIMMAVLAFAFFGCQEVNNLTERNTLTYSIAPDMYEHVLLGHNDGVYGPFTITKGYLVDGLKRKPIYLVGLHGTEFSDYKDENGKMINVQSTGLITDLLSGLCLDSPYLKTVIEEILANVPKNSNLVLTGHSLGGMIAQQVAADKSIKDNYNVLNTLTFGSPLIAAGSREGTTIRLGDSSDAIPYLSGSLINNTIWAIAGLNREDGKYGLDLGKAHNESYSRVDLWGNYDAVGKKNGKTKIVIDKDTLTFYKAPFFN